MGIWELQQNITIWRINIYIYTYIWEQTQTDSNPNKSITHRNNGTSVPVNCCQHTTHHGSAAEWICTRHPYRLGQCFCEKIKISALKHKKIVLTTTPTTFTELWRWLTARRVNHLQCGWTTMVTDIYFSYGFFFFFWNGKTSRLHVYTHANSLNNDSFR